MSAAGTSSARRRSRTKLDAAQSPLTALSKQTSKVRLGGRMQTLTSAERIAYGIFTSALAGKVRSIRIVFDWLEEREASSPDEWCLPQVLYERPDYAHVDEALLLLGLAEHDPSLDYENRRGLRLSLEHVNVALASVTLAQLTVANRNEIIRHTEQAELIIWPEEPADG